MFDTISASTNLNRKAKMGMRIFRAGTGKWEKLGFTWNTKQFLRESGIQFLNLFRTRKGFATVLTQIGEEYITDKLQETIQTTPDWIDWGTGAGTAAKSDTALFAESTEARVQGTMSQPAADKLRVVGTMTCAGAGKTITNAGSFTVSTKATGPLIIHGDFTGIVLAVGDKIEFSVDLEIS